MLVIAIVSEASRRIFINAPKLDSLTIAMTYILASFKERAKNMEKITLWSLLVGAKLKRMGRSYGWMMIAQLWSRALLLNKLKSTSLPIKLDTVRGRESLLNVLPPSLQT